ncbi:DUF6048 family protein [Moheibacter sediminis]|uniref:Outer membrane protein beta-barrel domain-containing protein n=1 Tax=Moheibacter sediminis TaxID=1434700 RepID=A0A1W1Z6V0_9FLAO|nr:DUF6048 family protein [Moheibacter sediminis]SMC44143.1 hypothetical protein SAMN06296427_102247 [Moheibacter sediminis]
MKQLQICIFIIIINLFAAQSFAQQDSINVKIDSVVSEKIDSLKPKNRSGNLFIGVDLFNPVMSVLSDKQGGQAMISYRITGKWNAVAEVGYEKNIYDELDWNIDVNGLYFKLGFNWFISQDYQDPSNGFYTGARVAYAMYEQKINQYPIRLSGNQVDDYGSLPAENVSAYWVEIVGGGRIQLFSNFYADVSIRPEIYIGSKKQEGIDPLLIPGYGKDIGPINFSVFWGLTYKLF